MPGPATKSHEEHPNEPSIYAVASSGSCLNWIIRRALRI